MGASESSREQPETYKTEAQRQAREDIEAAFGEWQPHERQYPLNWTSDEMLSYWTEAMFDNDRGIRYSQEYADAIEALLPAMLEAERSRFEQRAAQYWIARIGLPGSAHFSYSVHGDEESARKAIAEFCESAETLSERETARSSTVMQGNTCLWDTFRSGKCIYIGLLEQL